MIQKHTGNKTHRINMLITFYCSLSSQVKCFLVNLHRHFLLIKLMVLSLLLALEGAKLPLWKKPLFFSVSNL